MTPISQFCECKATWSIPVAVFLFTLASIIQLTVVQYCFFIDVLLIFLRCIFTKSVFNKHLFSVKLFSVKHVYKGCSESSWRDTVSHNMCTSYILSPFVIVSYNCCTLVPSFLQNTDSVVEKMFLVLKPAFAMHTSGGKIISNIQCCIVYHKLQFLQMY